MRAGEEQNVESAVDRLADGRAQGRRVFRQHPTVNGDRLDNGSAAAQLSIELACWDGRIPERRSVSLDGPGRLEGLHEFVPGVRLSRADGDRHVPFAEDGDRLWPAHGNRDSAQRAQNRFAVEARLSDLEQHPRADAGQEDDHVDATCQAAFRRRRRPPDWNRAELRASKERPSQRLPVVRSTNAFRRERRLSKLQTRNARHDHAPFAGGSVERAHRPAHLHFTRILAADTNARDRERNLERLGPASSPGARNARTMRTRSETADRKVGGAFPASCRSMVRLHPRPAVSVPSGEGLGDEE